MAKKKTNEATEVVVAAASRAEVVEKALEAIKERGGRGRVGVVEYDPDKEEGVEFWCRVTF